MFLTSGRRYGKWILVVVLLLLFDVGLWKKIQQKSVHQTPGNGKTVEVLLNTKNDSSEISTPSTDALQQPVKTVSDEYPYDIAEDRKSFDPSVIDITFLIWENTHLLEETVRSVLTVRVGTSILNFRQIRIFPDLLRRRPGLQ